MFDARTYRVQIPFGLKLSVQTLTDAPGQPRMLRSQAAIGFIQEAVTASVLAGTVFPGKPAQESGHAQSVGVAVRFPQTVALELSRLVRAGGGTVSDYVVHATRAALAAPAPDVTPVTALRQIAGAGRNVAVTPVPA